MAWRGTRNPTEVLLYPDYSPRYGTTGAVPIDEVPGTGLCGVEVTFTKLHAGGKFDLAITRFRWPTGGSLVVKRRTKTNQDSQFALVVTV